MTADVRTGIISDCVPCAVVSVGKGNRADVARRKRVVAGTADSAVTAANANAVAL